MGTTQRIIPGVSGEPNWRNLNVSITALANNVDQEINLDLQLATATERLDKNPSPANQRAVDELQHRKTILQNYIDRHYRSAMMNLVKTGGGSTKIATGKSSSLGRAGLRNAQRIAGFVGGVHRAGLESTLKSIGLTNLKGKPMRDIIDALLIYLCDTSFGMDEIAANMACCQITEELAGGVKTVEEFEVRLRGLIDEQTLQELLCRFFGLYLFEHLSQRFEEKIEQSKGGNTTKETFTLIKDDIIGQVKVINTKQPIDKIDWQGSQGKTIIEKIFMSIIKLFE